MVDIGGDLLWLMSSLYLIDFNYQVFLSECIKIGYTTKGVFSYEALKNMPFCDYMDVNKQVDKLVEGLKNG